MGRGKTAANFVGQLAVLAIVAACGRTVDKKVSLDTLTAEQIYQRAEGQLASERKAKTAVATFAEIERLYPYSEWAKRALIMEAYGYHKDRDYENSRSAAQRYIDTYPAEEDAAYAKYLLALSYYDQIEEVGRDQGLTFQALQALRAVIEQYPDSEYAKSAILKFDLAFDHLAAKEMEIGRYYLKRKNYAAALNRFRIVVEQYQTTTQTPEALYRLIECYLSLGLNDEAQTAGAILGYNFQATDWYQDGYKLLTKQGLEAKPRGDGWLASIYRQMIRGEWL